MRAKEFLTEQELDHVHDYLEVVSKSLPYTYVIPELPNNDFYKQYRFGVAIAAVRGDSGKDHKVPEFHAQSSWGEQQIVSSFDPNIGKVIDKALHKVGLKGKKEVSTPGSDEFDDTDKQSPIKPFKGYKRK